MSLRYGMMGATKHSASGTKSFWAARDITKKPNSATLLGWVRREFAVREEFASYGFLAVACAGVCLLSAGLIALVLS
jgi:hypothetical protein